MSRSSGLSRRHMLQATGAVAVASVLVRPASATPASMQGAIRKVVGEGKVTVGRVRLEIAPLTENGNSVTCAINVESPMTAKDHVKAIHLFNERIRSPM